jgi:hypothetical protein
MPLGKAALFSQGQFLEKPSGWGICPLFLKVVLFRVL